MTRTHRRHRPPNRPTDNRPTDNRPAGVPSRTPGADPAGPAAPADTSRAAPGAAPAGPGGGTAPPPPPHTHARAARPTPDAPDAPWPRPAYGASTRAPGGTPVGGRGARGDTGPRNSADSPGAPLTATSGSRPQDAPRPPSAHSPTSPPGGGTDSPPPAALGQGARGPAAGAAARALGGTPPRAPGGRAPAAAGGGRPARPAAGPARATTRPADNRPAAAPGRAPAGTRVPAPRRPAVPQQRPTDVFAERLLAVLSGRSPVHAMLRHTMGAAYDDLAHLAAHGPLRAAHGPRPVIRDIGYYEPRPGALEAFARIGTGDRLRAMAFRLERGPDQRWRCTAVELGGPRRHPAPHDD
ncbi:Rv3235 family protein [Streptomyces sp. bgisy159]|uniref:Rv3235 family protein n=1 Tax=Streptomyces sp. bgisy159 TaxID=3413795 RepID=UPI003F4A3FB2